MFPLVALDQPSPRPSKSQMCIRDSLKGVLVFFSIPLIILTLGAFMLVLNAFLLWLTNKLVPTVEILSLIHI